ncbi:hypothetical protein BJX62DRAFT_242625 [Aspergillus germanicus]
MEFKIPVLSQFLGFAAPGSTSNPFTEPPKPSRLQELPAEIHLLILHYLKHRDKLSLLRASRFFYDLLLPLFYENLNTRCTHNLVETLVRTPSLCAYPRSLRLHAWKAPIPQGPGEGEGEAERSIGIIDIDLILRRWDPSLVLAKAREASLSDEEAARWEADIKRENADAWTGLLLTLLPNLVRLYVQFPQHSVYVPRVIQSAASGQYTSIPVLQNIQEVAVSAAFEPDRESVPSLVSPFFGLPRLRWLTTDALFDGETHNHTPTQTSPITHLSIGWNRGGLERLDDLVKNCPHLESFRYGYFPYSWCDPLLNHYLYPALLQRKQSLKKLWLDINSRHDAGALSRTWPSFSEFSALELLHVPHHLLGHFYHHAPETETVRGLPDLLPPSLETLHVTAVGTSAVNALFPCLAEYVRLRSRQAQQGLGQELTELVIASATFLPNMDNANANSDLDISTASITDPDTGRPPRSLLDHVIDLRDTCIASGTRFAIHRKDSRALAHWEFKEPFPRRDLR